MWKNFFKVIVCAFLFVADPWMTYPTKVKGSPTLFFTLNTLAFFKVWSTSESTASSISERRKHCGALAAVWDMKNQLARQINGIPVSCQNQNPSSSNTSLALTHSKILSHSFLLCMSAMVLENFSGTPFANGVVFKIAGKVDRKKNMMIRYEKKADNFVHGIREHGKYLFHLISFNLILQD